jgi:hypothetical protein
MCVGTRENPKFSTGMIGFTRYERSKTHHAEGPIVTLEGAIETGDAFPEDYAPTMEGIRA